MRLDKFLVECGLGSRSEVKELISKKEISINDNFKISNKDNINLETDIVKYKNEIITYKEFRYYIMNKKAGYITATEDIRDKTVMDLLPSWVIKKDLAPVGRLDKDTEGLLLFTNDGILNHKLLSPKSHVEKTYYVKAEKEVSEANRLKLEEGIDIGGYITLPAKAKIISKDEILLSIQEGKFHQVKKMLVGINNKVTYLKRVTFGKLELKDLELGEVREVSKEDIV